jgi:lipoprotein NlpI
VRGCLVGGASRGRRGNHIAAFALQTGGVMRFGLCWAAALVGIVLATGVANAELAPEWRTCTGKIGLDWDEQIRSCTALIQSDRETLQDRLTAYSNRAMAYNVKGDRDRAIADYSEAIRLDPKYARPYNGRGNAYRAKGDLDRAIADYDEAIRLDPKYAAAYNDRGGAYQAKGDLDRAIVYYNEAIRLDPKYANAYANRGDAYRAKGDLDGAIADSNVAIRLNPKDVIAYNNRGNAYQAKGDLDRAIADYNEVISINPKISATYFSRGIAYVYSGSLAKAQADFKQSNQLNPKDAYAALWLDVAERRNNIPSHLAQTATPLDKTAWPAPLVRLFLGELNSAQTMAAADDKDPTTKRAQVCEVNFYSGELALARGAKDEATRLFRLAVSDCPRIFVERDGANAELKALGVAP